VKQLVLEISPPPAPTFANFVAGRNVEAVHAVKAAVTGNHGPTTKVLYVWGVAGAGKSHLLTAFKTETVSTAQAVGGADLHVVVDDVERLGDAQQVALFDAINQRALDPQAMVLVSGSLAPRDLPVRPELSSRLGSGLVFCLQPLTDAEKMAAVRAHAASRGFGLRDDVVAYLFRHGRRDMASLIGSLDALDRFSLETGREITLPMLRQMEQPELEFGSGH